jgi:hypothetical protein
MLTDSNRLHETDKKFVADVAGAQFANRLFVRLVAKGRRFTDVDFKYSIFDTCYLRNCTFDSCDFTGCRFIGTNLHGTGFTGCKFDYASFERTLIDNDVLDVGCPGPENLKLRFARTLRMNYQQLGDAKSVNKAMGVELRATEIHLHKAWHSNESYYRKKYKKWDRFKAFLEWVEFKVLDFIWGNGESVPKLLRTVLVILVLMSLIDAIAFKDAQRLRSYFQAFLDAPQIFLGTVFPKNYSELYLTGILLVRLVMFGFFMSIIIKRFNRR